MNENTSPAILVAGVGNIFLGDDGFGCEVIRELMTCQQMCGVALMDYGIRGLDLAYALLDPYQAVILVDAIARGGAAGSLYVLQPVLPDHRAARETPLDAHSMDPLHLLAMARSLGEITADIFIVGCEPLDFGDPLEGRMKLSDIVTASVPKAMEAVAELVDRVRLREVQNQAAVCEAP